MGYFGKVQLQIDSVKLRRSGHSIRFIEKKLNVARSSAALWVKNVKLTEKQIDKLYRNCKSGRLKGSYIATQNKIKKRVKRVKEIEANAEKEIANLSKRDKFMLGVALYFGEGSKTSHNVYFTNSEPSAMVFMKNWFLEFCAAKPGQMRCNIYLHDNLDERKANKYWSLLLDIPLNQFGKTYLVKNNPQRLRKSKHIYGVCRLTISDINMLRRIMGWIKASFFV
jgi:hypothetical protein